MKLFVKCSKVFAFVLPLSLPFFASAAVTAPQGGFAWPTFSPINPDMTIQQIVSVVGIAFTALIGFVSVIALIGAGILYMTSTGNEEQIEKAKNIIKYAITGVIIAVLSFVITTFLINIFFPSPTQVPIK